MNALAALEALLVDPHDQEQRDKAFDHAEVRHMRHCMYNQAVLV